MARCPECNAKLVVAPDVERWDRISCTICNIELEVVALDPLELEAVYDFDDDDNTLDELEEDSEDEEWEEPDADDDW